MNSEFKCDSLVSPFSTMESMGKEILSQRKIIEENTKMIVKMGTIIEEQRQFIRKNEGKTE